jgi:hypothetical protein
MAHQKNRDRLRASIANEAARIIHDSGHNDYSMARTKAAQRFGCKDKRKLPSNEEIEQALMEYQQLFHAEQGKRRLNTILQLAREAMTNFERFSPRMAGPLHNNNSHYQNKLQLHLFSDSPELIAHFLIERGIPYQETEKPVSFIRGQRQIQPAFSFYAEETELELIWFPSGSIGHPPLSSINQKPEKRISITQVINAIELE